MSSGAIGAQPTAKSHHIQEEPAAAAAAAVTLVQAHRQTRTNQISRVAERNADRSRLGAQLKRKAADWCSKVVGSGYGKSSCNSKNGGGGGNGSANTFHGRRRRTRRTAITTSGRATTRSMSVYASSLVDKLTYMIKKTSADSTGPATTPSTTLLDRQRDTRTSTIADSAQQVSTTGGANSTNSNGGVARASNSSSSGGGGSGNSSRHLISELTWRLVKRCSRTSRVAVQFESSSDSANTTILTTTSTTSGSGSATNKHRRRDNRLASSSSSGSTRTTKLLSSSHYDDATAAAAADLRALGVNWQPVRQKQQDSSSSMATATAIAAQPSDSLEREQQQQAAAASFTQLLEAQPGGGGGGGGLQPAAPSSYSSSSTTSIAAAVAANQTSSTVNNTSCCYCDETASSSGFVSSSGSGGMATNCSDSITTHSCSSSAYNEPIVLSSSAVAAVDQQAAAASSSLATKQNIVGEQAQQVVDLDSGTLTRDAQQLAGQSSDSSRKKTSGGSFLQRARESTMNLASLATGRSQRFTSSASVGNIWSSSSTSNGQRRELAELSGESQAVRPLDYTARAHFDQDDLPAAASAAEVTSCGGRKHDSMDSGIQIVAPKGSGGTASASAASKTPPAPPKSGGSPASKEKKRRQKEAEKVEKLRLLVSYLRSGSSQQILAPVELEADEIELAERYKSHLVLCEDCLQATEQQVSCTAPVCLTPNLSSTSLAANAGLFPLPTTNRLARSQTPEAPPPRDTASNSSINNNNSNNNNDIQLNTIAGIVINVRRSSDQTLGQHSSNSSASQGSARDNYLSPIGSPGGANNNNNNNTNHHHQLSVSQQNVSSNSSSSPSINDDIQQLVAAAVDLSPEQRALQDIKEQQQLRCYRCNRLTGRHKNSLASSVDLTTTTTNNASCSVAAAAADTDSRPMPKQRMQLENDAQHSHQPPLTNVNNNNSQNLLKHQSPVGSNNNHYHHHINSHQNDEDHLNNHQQHSFHFQPDNEQISFSSDRSLSGGSDNGNQASGAKLAGHSLTGSAVVRPASAHNLATWIDNEVNSLVNDLEAKSQLVENEKYAKSSSKRKWLTGSNRRNSSGAHST